MSLEYLVQVHIYRSLGQGQDHSRKRSHEHNYTHLQVVILQLKGSLGCLLIYIDVCIFVRHLLYI